MISTQQGSAEDARQAGPSGLSAYEETKHRVHQRLIAEIDPAKVHAGDGRQAREAVEDAALSALASEDPGIAPQQQQRLAREIADEILGLGPLEPLLSDPTISEVMVNAPEVVYIERDGVIHLSEKRFRDTAHIMQVVERIIAPLGRRVDEVSPMVDARLPSGYRVNVIIPPLALGSPSVTIRKFSEDRFHMAELVSLGTLSERAAELLKATVAVRLNLLISGGAGTGKTTLLNALSAYIPEGERIITIEDPAELKLKQAHVVRLETRPPNMEGKYQVTQRDLVRNSLRMRPDRIIVGEVRAGEAFDMLQAMNTGHDGSICTVHANSPRDAIARVENMVLMAGLDLPVRAVREQLASAVHLIVHLSRFRDGTRRVTQITEIVGMEGQVVTTQDIFAFQHEGVGEDGRIVGSLAPTGIRPKFADRFNQSGIHLPADIFSRARG